MCQISEEIRAEGRAEGRIEERTEILRNLGITEDQYAKILAEKQTQN